MAFNHPLCKHYTHVHTNESKIRKRSLPVDFKVNVFFGKSIKRESGDGNTINSCVDLVDELLESENTKENYDYYSTRIKFTWDCDNEFIIKSIIGDYCDLYLKTKFSKKGKLPRLRKWEIYGIQSSEKKQSSVYEKLALLTMSDYGISTSFIGSFQFSECVLLVCIDAK
jgi:hypothetical protein